MKSNLLAKLRTNGSYYLISAFLLLLGVPLYQLFFLTPLGYGDALNATGTNRLSTYLAWISAHVLPFLIYRFLLIAAFALLLTLPFTLFRIIVAQELMGQIEQAEEDVYEEDEEDEGNEEAGIAEEDEGDGSSSESSGLPEHPWRGKGFAVVAAWSGLLGLALYTAGTTLSTLYLLVVSRGFTPNTAAPTSFTLLSGIFSVTANVLGIGLLALSTLFFGAIIARSGRKLWPDSWVGFGYLALATAALLSGSAVAVASSATDLTTPATLLFAVWILWLSIMLVTLKPES